MLKNWRKNSCIFDISKYNNKTSIFRKDNCIQIILVFFMTIQSKHRNFKKRIWKRNVVYSYIIHNFSLCTLFFNMYDKQKQRKVFNKRNKFSRTRVIETKMNGFTTDLEKSLSLVNVYFWIHLIGFDRRFQWKLKYKMKIIISFALLGMVETHNLYRVYIQFQSIYTFEGQKQNNKLLMIVSQMSEIILRIILYLKRNKLFAVNRQLVSLSKKINAGQILNLKFNLLILFFANDFLIIMPLVMGRITKQIRQSNFNAKKFISAFAFNWIMVTPIFPIIFCSYCIFLIQIGKTLKKELCSKTNVNISHFFYVYDEIISLITELNEIFQNTLFITLSAMLWWIFYDSYLLTFPTPKSFIASLDLICYTSTIFIRFILVCYTSALVTKSIYEVKDLLFSYPNNETHMMLKIQNKFVGFTLLDSIVIGKNLILVSISTLVTYGILIATCTTNWTSNKN